MTNTTQDVYTQRAAKIEELLENHPEVMENGFTLSAEPRQFLTVELQCGDGVWAYNDGSLQEVARSIEESDTRADDYMIVDLDTGRHFIPVTRITSFLCGDGQQPSRVDL